MIIVTVAFWRVLLYVRAISVWGLANPSLGPIFSNMLTCWKVILSVRMTFYEYWIITIAWVKLYACMVKDAVIYSGMGQLYSVSCLCLPLS